MTAGRSAGTPARPWAVGLAWAVWGLAMASLAVAGATLAVAALFRPVRRRVQEAVDRRFNRRRHNAAAIEAFCGRLHQQADPDTLTAELLAVVDQTMQPTRASLVAAAVGHRDRPRIS